MLKSEQKDGVVVLIADESRLDAASAPRFRSEATTAVNGASQVVLDASALEFVDSTGLGALVSLLKAIGPSGSLVVAGARHQVQKLFAVTKLDRVFVLEPSLEDALQRFRA